MIGILRANAKQNIVYKDSMSYRNKITKTHSKVLMTITVVLTANILMIPCLIGILLVECNGLAAVSLYITFCFVRVPYYSSVRVNTIDLSPRHAGVLQGILSSSSAIAALFMSEFFNGIAGHEVCAYDKLIDHYSLEYMYY